MKKSLFTSVLLFLAGVLSAQPVIQFSRTTHDFGTIQEADGKATTIYEFTNTGNAPLVITQVSASCGCTSPEWTKTPIEPGQKGAITATYNPAGRPGKFRKTITVSSNASVPTTRLVIAGEVIAKPAQLSYPIQMGHLSLSSKTAQFGNMFKGEEKVVTIECANNTGKPITVAILPNDSFIETTVMPSTIEAGKTAQIHILFNTKVCKQWGAVATSVLVSVNGSKINSDNYKINVRATVAEDFSKLTTSERQKAPIVELSTQTVALGTIKSNTQISQKVEVTNSGQNPLEIRRIVNNSTEVKAVATKSTISGNKKGEIKIDIDTKDLPIGNYRRSLSIITNDPEKSQLPITISWTIE